MITAYLWGTPNGYKIAIALEEMGLDYQIEWIDITNGEQHQPGFLKVAPNGKIPAIEDHDTGIRMMESGAILQYLAEKSGRFGGETLQERAAVSQWLHWQMGGLGPMMGQANHFRGLKDKVPYGETRYLNETVRLFQVLDAQLEGRDYIAGDYSIADIAAVAWAGIYPMMEDARLDACSNVVAWVGRNVARPATARAIALQPPKASG
jgi:GST-like protein